MQVEIFHDAAAFLDAAEPWLRAGLVENSLPYGIACTARNQPGCYGDTAWFALVRRGARPLLAALRTPPRPVVLSQGALEAVPALAAALREAQPDNPGVIGPSGVAEALARAVAPEAWRQGMAMRAYELTEVLPDPRRPNGVLRRVSPDERPRLVRWVDGFDRDAHLEAAEPAEAVADRMLQGGRAWVFENDAGMVALAGGVDIPGLGRIGMVYTPPELRGQGLGSAATAAFSAQLLASGARACALFTDLSNQTSNAIYQRVGYRPVCDWADLRFEGAPRVQ